MKISSFGSKATTINFFFLTSSTNLVNRQDLYYIIQPLFKLLIIEIILYIAKDKERYPKSNIYINISQYKDLLKKMRLSIFVIFKKSNYHTKHFHLTIINLLNINVIHLYTETYIFYKTQSYCVVLTTQFD